MEYQRQKALEFAQFFETGMFVDLKIFCNDPINDDGDGEKESKFFNVHKVVMASASPYLKSEILKSTTDDSTLPVAIKLDMKYNIVKSIIDFIYLENAIIPKKHLKEFFRCCQLLQIGGLQDPAVAIKKEPIASTSKFSDESNDNKPELEDESETTEESDLKPPPQKKLKTESGVPASLPPRFAKQPDGRIVCLSCSKNFGFLQNAKRHHKLTHTEPTEILKCLYCTKEFRFKFYLDQHLLTAHKITQAMLKNPIP